MVASAVGSRTTNYDDATSAPPGTRAPRIPSLDIVRGAVMVLMAIDHVRVYAGVPPGGSDPAVFFTRWVTHFCAPAFVFLAGTAASLYGRRVASHGALSRFLLTRGLWLVLLELTVLRFAWTFNFDYAGFTFAGVIWAIGWSMVALAALSLLPAAAVGAIGVLVVVLHDAFGPLAFAVESPSWLLRVLYVGWSFPLAGPGWNVVVLYSLVPWVGVMAAGYGFGPVMKTTPELRRTICLTLGLSAVAVFALLRATGGYGDPRPWNPSDGVLGFLNTAKYPASLQFLLMTLGPTLVAVALLERARGRVARWLEVFGRVPFFYYVLHIPLIHLVAVAISVVRTPEHTGWLFANHPMLPPDVPPDYRWSLALLYVVTAAVVVALYVPCRWFARVKAEGRWRWTRYL